MRCLRRRGGVGRGSRGCGPAVGGKLRARAVPGQWQALALADRRSEALASGVGGAGFPISHPCAFSPSGRLAPCRRWPPPCSLPHAGRDGDPGLARRAFDVPLRGEREGPRHGRAVPCLGATGSHRSHPPQSPSVEFVLTSHPTAANEITGLAAGGPNCMGAAGPRDIHRDAFLHRGQARRATDPPGATPLKPMRVTGRCGHRPISWPVLRLAGGLPLPICRWMHR